jgi:hypothetical protein
VPLSSAPYAKSDCAKQNTEIRLKTVQDYRDRKSDAPARIPQAFDVVEKREAQATNGEIDRSRQDRHLPNHVESAFWLIPPLPNGKTVTIRLAVFSANIFLLHQEKKLKEK